MRVIHAYSSISSAHGGIVAALAALLPSLEARGVECDLVALEPRGETRAQSPLDSPRLHLARGRGPGAIGFAPELGGLLDQLARDAHAIHSHGLWLYLDGAAAGVARRQKLPHIISVHGMMEPYAWNRSRPKKAVAGALFQSRALRDARVLHALVPGEVENIRQLGFSNAVALVPNGVNLSEVDDLPARAVFDALVPAAKDRKILLFLARLHPKKGLLHFLPAWKRALSLSGACDWHFVIAGPDEGQHRAELEALVATLELQNHVSFVGLLGGETKRAALGAACAFVLPSHSEGFSMSLLEALAARLPLLITPGCNFPESVRAGAALCVEANENAALEGLQQLFSLSSSQLETMGRNGRALVERDYTWSSVAQKWQAVYGWCCGQGDKPECVIEQSEG